MSEGARTTARADNGRIETIFWDIGGVLLTNGWDVEQRARVLTDLGVNLAAYEAVHEKENWFWERGLMTAKEFFERTVISANPGLGLTFDQLWPLVCNQSKVLHPECFEILRGLRKEHEVRLATLNNESRELNDYRMDAFALRGCFDFLICSGYLGEMKPAPELYKAAIEISGRPAQTGLFIDDKAENCEAARANGMQAIHFQTPAQLKRDLQQHGVDILRTQAEKKEAMACS